MKEIRYFECEYCGWSTEDEEEMLNHEGQHEIDEVKNHIKLYDLEGKEIPWIKGKISGDDVWFVRWTSAEAFDVFCEWYYNDIGEYNGLKAMNKMPDGLMFYNEGKLRSYWTDARDVFDFEKKLRAML